MENFHTPVLLQEVINYLVVTPGAKYIDATLGGGGHGIEILKQGGVALGIDCDPQAIEYTRRRWKVESRRWKIDEKNLTLIQGNFRDLKEIALSNNFKDVSGILFDLGVSTHQLLTPARGFSFNAESPLDMRMDPSLKVEAADLVNGLTKGELYDLFTKLGEEDDALAIAQVIVRARAIRKIKTCRELAQLVAQVKGKRESQRRIHPATKVFQALRMAVNGELENLRLALPQAVELLAPQGRLVVISFHSLEDRIVKFFFKGEPKIKVLTEHPLRVSEEEERINPRSRSAKMRVVERIN